MRFVFLDTSLFLHYKSIDQIDWWALASVKDRVDLIVCAPVLRELEMHKDGQRDQRLRQRARETVSRLDQWVGLGEEHEIRSGVWLRIVVDEAPEDCYEDGLTANIVDDQTIASAIHFSRRVSLAKGLIGVAAADYLMRLKVKKHGLQPLQPDDGDKLQSIPTEQDVLIAKLQAEITAYRNATPEIDVFFQGGSKVLKPKLKAAVRLSADAMQRLIEEERTKYPRLQNISQQFKSDDPLGRVFASAEEAQHVFNPRQLSASSYNEQLEPYFERFASWLKVRERHKDFAARSTRVAIEIANTGTAPARGLTVDVLAHSLISFHTLKELFTEPSKPEPPSKLRGDNPFWPLYSSGIEKMVTLPRVDVDPSVKVSMKQITVDASKLQQSESIKFTRAILWAEEPVPVECVVRIRADNIPGERTTTLTIVPRLASDVIDFK